MQQPLDVRHLDKNRFVSWMHHPTATMLDREHEDIRLPIMDEASPRSERHVRIDDHAYCFDSKKSHVVIREEPVRDHFKSSLFACLTCFWMIGGLVCFVQAVKIRCMLKNNSSPLVLLEARRRSNRLYTNLVITYVVGGMISGALVTTLLVTFIVGIKGYYSRSL